MHVVSRAPFDTATRQFPNQAAALDDVYRTLKRENYTSPDEMKKRIASLDRMKYREKWWVIDVGGGNLRVMFFANEQTDSGAGFGYFFVIPFSFCRGRVGEKNSE